MGRPREEDSELFDVRIKVMGEDALTIRKYVEDKKKKDRRKTIINTVEAILLEAAEQHKK